MLQAITITAPAIHPRTFWPGLRGPYRRASYLTYMGVMPRSRSSSSSRLPSEKEREACEAQDVRRVQQGKSRAELSRSDCHL